MLAVAGYVTTMLRALRKVLSPSTVDNEVSGFMWHVVAKIPGRRDAKANVIYPRFYT